MPNVFVPDLQVQFNRDVSYREHQTDNIFVGRVVLCDSTTCAIISTDGKIRWFNPQTDRWFYGTSEYLISEFLCKPKVEVLV